MMDLAPLAGPLVVTGGAFFILGLDMVFGRRRQLTGLLQLATFVFVAAGMFLELMEMSRVGHAEVSFSGAVKSDGLSAFLSFLALLATGVTVILSFGYIARRGIKVAEYYALLLLASAGMVFLIRAEDLITLFLSIELMSISVYALCGIMRDDARAAEASMKYFVSGAFASAFLLYGSALLYGASGGTVQLSQIPGNITEPVLGGIGLLLLLIGFFFKVGAVPFHQWVPDAYEGAPTSVTAFMSVGVKVAAFGALLRVVIEAGVASQEVAWIDVFTSVCVVTMIGGNVLAAVQTSVKRMLAYSGVAHTGYAMIGVVLAARAEEAGHLKAAVGGTLIYLLAYALMTLGAFAFVIYAGRNGRDAETYEDYSGLAARRPWAALAMSIFMLSLAGIPPTAGFIGKFMLFRAAVQQQAFVLVIVGVLTTLVSLYYYLRVMVFMYMKPAPQEEPGDADPNAGWAVLLTAVFTMAVGLFPGIWYSRVVLPSLEFLP